MPARQRSPQPERGYTPVHACPAGLPGAGGGELHAQVVARVTGAVRFGGLADFQYLSHDARPAQEQARMQQALLPPGPCQNPSCSCTWGQPCMAP